ncbi:hypothetical protein EVJ58_g10856 [Rhodofomes roseus]|uniref:Uncharacterized protein n=1 Tax=Rhodofomes roseus TaxID=34475 RepID=A0A4Y9XKU7_9APHY|nr:hypothetical protein EVJ58_g10856 [Rhodofomes roseus]
MYFFIDGVDEEVARATGSVPRRDSDPDVLDILGTLDSFVTQRETKARGSVHLWFSSQDNPNTRRRFERYTQFDIKDAVKPGIQSYLSCSIDNLTVAPPERRKLILKQLTDRAKSNFLWAHLMVDELEKATSLAEMDRILEEGRVDDLDKYYATFLNKLSRSTGHRASISRDVFSLVAFARRPLRVGEIQEAIAILNSEYGCLDHSQKPFLRTLLELFSPLIECYDDGPSDPPLNNDDHDLQKTCRLFHSTLSNFLRRHADILCDEVDEEATDRSHTNFRVCPLRIADTCLLYLSQDRYSRLLRRRDGDTWIDTENQCVSEHRFLAYSAKNWDKHLDLVAPDGGRLNLPSVETAANAIITILEQFRTRVETFVNSTNFQTCMQTLEIDAAACSTALYAVCVSDASDSQSLDDQCGRDGGTPLAAFSLDGQCLRIGTHLYIADETGEYTTFPVQEGRYIEEIACHDDMVVVARRQTRPKAKIKDTSHRQTGQATNREQENSDSDDERSNKEDEGTSSEDESSSDGGYYETWSECSSDPEHAYSPSGDDDESSDDDRSSRDGDEDAVGSDSDDSTDSDSSSSPDIGSDDGSPIDERDVEDEGYDNDDSEDGYADSDVGVDRSAFAFGQIDPYGEEDHYGHRGHDVAGTDGTGSVQRSSLRIYTPDGLLFKSSIRISTSLSDSPPIFHPTHTLLVWPLSGREILFVDHDEDTYFVHKLNAGSASAQLVRCHFTDDTDGEYLHIAAFEALQSQGEDSPTSARLHLYSYRLCTTKPTRSRPRLVHESDVLLPTVSREKPSSRLPCTLTWTDTHLYVTWSATRLTVHQVPLLRQKEPQDSAAIQQPGETMLLPGSAESRDVFFIPSEDDSLARVIIGGPIATDHGVVPAGPTTPVGCIVRTDEHLGGWVTADSTPLHRDREAIVPLENFDPDVDCILEPFVWLE